MTISAVAARSACSCTRSVSHSVVGGRFGTGMSRNRASRRFNPFTVVFAGSVTNTTGT